MSPLQLSVSSNSRNLLHFYIVRFWKGGKPDRKPYPLPDGLEIHTETSSLSTLKFKHRSLKEIVRSWIWLRNHCNSLYVHLKTPDVEEFDGGRPPGGHHHPPRLAQQPPIRRGQVPQTTNLWKFCVFYFYCTYVSSLTLLSKESLHAVKGKSHLCIPFLEIVRPQSQFPHSCVCEQFIYSQDRSTYFPAAE